MGRERIAIHLPIKSTRGEVLRRLRGHVRAEGRVVIGFGADRDYEFSAFLTDAREVGLEPELLLSTWDLRPWSEHSEFLVALLRPSETAMAQRAPQ